MTKTGQERFAEKQKRITTAESLGVPDRVPLLANCGFFAARMVGMTIQEATYDIKAWLDANRKYLEEYDPDMFYAPNIPSGAVHDILETTQIKWPGHGVDEDTTFQFVEGEYMTQDEYDLFLDDASDFNVRTYLPRVHRALKGFSKLPPLLSIARGYGSPFVSAFSDPELLDSLEKLVAAAKVQAQWGAAIGEYVREAEANGYVNFLGGMAMAPFDLISDMLRGMKGSMFDMFQEPDKLLAAQEKLLPLLTNAAISSAKASGNPRIFIPLHRGADGFMSIKQFEKFYWPQLKKLIEDLTAAGCITYPFFEGTYDQRLEYLQDLPHGKTVAWFDRSDMARVKEMLGGKLCIAGGMPVSLLQSSTVEGVKEYTRKLIDTAGSDGGFIMVSSVVFEEGKPELVKAWHDATKEYVY